MPQMHQSFKLKAELTQEGFIFGLPDKIFWNIPLCYSYYKEKACYILLYSTNTLTEKVPANNNLTAYQQRGV